MGVEDAMATGDMATGTDITNTGHGTGIILTVTAPTDITGTIHTDTTSIICTFRSERLSITSRRASSTPFATQERPSTSLGSMSIKLQTTLPNTCIRP